MSKGGPGGVPKSDREEARRERQARELRENLLRRKDQSRARSARQRKPPETAIDDGNDA